MMRRADAKQPAQDSLHRLRAFYILAHAFAPSFPCTLRLRLLALLCSRLHRHKRPPHPTAAPHPVTLNDLFRFHDVGSPELSPDGQWVAYTVSTVDTKADKRTTDIWMVSWDGKENIRLTYGSDSAEDANGLGSSGSPRWSPDGRYLSFTAGRPGQAKGSRYGCSIGAAAKPISSPM